MNHQALLHPSAGVARFAALAILGCSAVVTAAEPRLVPSADGTEVTDTSTGLVWRRCSAGQTYSQGTCIGSAGTYTHEGALAYARTQVGWRLPSVKELASIVDDQRRLPSIDPSAFPATSVQYYWSSSSDGSISWSVDFHAGYVFPTGRDNLHFVRLVRN